MCGRFRQNIDTGLSLFAVGKNPVKTNSGIVFHISLAAKLRSFISSKGIDGQVQVYHFHDWCGEQLKTYHVDLVQSERQVWERQVDSVIDAVERGQIPRAQYGALLIDEGHDFEPEWLKLVVQMVDPESTHYYCYMMMPNRFIKTCRFGVYSVECWDRGKRPHNHTEN
jgi:hypothetical protein